MSCATVILEILARIDVRPQERQLITRIALQKRVMPPFGALNTPPFNYTVCDETIRITINRRRGPLGRESCVTLEAARGSANGICQSAKCLLCWQACLHIFFCFFSVIMH